MKLTNELIQKYVDERLVVKKKHESFDYYIYDYTPKVQFEKLWDEVTMSCRGLILDGKNNIIARPFKKFFNYEEIFHTGDFSGNYTCFEKADGSLGITYLGPNDELYFSTRGSFSSEQAREAMIMVPSVFSKEQISYLKKRLRDGYTELFEIIYPTNRIVVDYKGRRTLKYLGSVYRKTGEFSFQPSLYPDSVEMYGANASLDELKKNINPEAEGYVIRFDNGTVCKMKGDEYVRLHRLLTNVTAKNIWEVLRIGADLNSFLENVPDEFYNWVKKTKESLLTKYDEIEKYHLDFMNKIDLVKEINITFIGTPNRKDMARLIKQKSDNDKNIISSICFAMIDKKDYSDIIWKMIRPGVEKPFKEET